MQKKELKTLGDAIGMPDDIDKERIRKIILKYEKKYPGQITYTRDVAKRDFQDQGGRKARFGEVNKQAHGRVLFELPEELHRQLEEYIPTLFRETKHFQWFCRNFKELLIVEKY